MNRSNMKLNKLVLYLFSILSFQWCIAQNIVKTNKIALEGDRADYKVFSVANHGVLIARYPEILVTTKT